MTRLINLKENCRNANIAELAEVGGNAIINITLCRLLPKHASFKGIVENIKKKFFNLNCRFNAKQKLTFTLFNYVNRGRNFYTEYIKRNEINP